MIKIINYFKKFYKADNLDKITEKELNKNIEVIKSLRDYDEGKKEISTHNIQKYLPRVRVTSE